MTINLIKTGFEFARAGRKASADLIAAKEAGQEYAAMRRDFCVGLIADALAEGGKLTAKLEAEAMVVYKTPKHKLAKSTQKRFSRACIEAGIEAPSTNGGRKKGAKVGPTKVAKGVKTQATIKASPKTREDALVAARQAAMTLVVMAKKYEFGDDLKKAINDLVIAANKAS